VPGNASPPPCPGPEARMTRRRLNLTRQGGSCMPPDGPVHVSINGYLIHRRRDIPRVIREGRRRRRLTTRSFTGGGIVRSAPASRLRAHSPRSLPRTAISITWVDFTSSPHV
jgi:hypothetical protein